MIDTPIIDIVKDNFVHFRYLRQGTAFYDVYITNPKHQPACYIFPVPLDDLGEATLLNRDKAILFMRYIRQAIADGTFTKVEA